MWGVSCVTVRSPVSLLPQWEESSCLICPNEKPHTISTTLKTKQNNPQNKAKQPSKQKQSKPQNKAKQQTHKCKYSLLGIRILKCSSNKCTNRMRLWLRLTRPLSSHFPFVSRSAVTIPSMDPPSFSSHGSYLPIRRTSHPHSTWIADKITMPFPNAHSTQHGECAGHASPGCGRNDASVL